MINAYSQIVSSFIELCNNNDNNKYCKQHIIYICIYIKSLLTHIPEGPTSATV